MIEVTTSLALLLAVTWPLLLAVGLAFGATRSVALRLVPWAALPALATVAMLADTGLRLPGAMLGSALVLDGMGRVFLLLSAFLWLATGLLARPQLHDAGANRFAVLLLLAMTGAFGLALAADALLFFTAATLAGYALYGLLVHEANVSAQKAGRVLVVLLVVSDLLVFELLLMLGQAAGSVDFPSLRQAFVDSGNQGLMLGLLIVGFGIKTGVVGVHFWLAPVFVTSVTAVRPALISFIFSAGLLGWLRLLPLGDIHDIHWTGAGAVLQWLAWVTLGYAVFVGLLQAHFRSVLAYAAIALSGFWVATLGSALLYPQAWNGMAESTHAAVLQSGFALAALLLLDWRTGGCAPAWLRRISTGVMWLATLLIGGRTRGHHWIPGEGRWHGGGADVLCDGCHRLPCHSRPAADWSPQPGCSRHEYFPVRHAATRASAHDNVPAGGRGAGGSGLAGCGIQPGRAITFRTVASRHGGVSCRAGSVAER